MKRIRRWFANRPTRTLVLCMGLTFASVTGYNEWDDTKDDARIARAGCLTSLDTRDRIRDTLSEFRTLTDPESRTRAVIDHQIDLLAEPTPLCEEVGIDTPTEVEDAMVLIRAIRRHRSIFLTFDNAIAKETP